MTKGDEYFKKITSDILKYGSLDKNPRPHYADGTPAHTLSINHIMCSYDLTKNESPFITLRPIATKAAFGELLWIYRDQSNDLELLKNKYNITWWDEWDIGNRTIGQCYGATINRYDLTNKLINGIKNDPDGRRHIISMWQENDFNEKHGLKPCAFLTIWNVRHGNDGIDYLDMCLIQRSSDFLTAGCINQVQYCGFLIAIANHLNYVPGKFTWFADNVQIYDRHIEQAKEMLNRKSIECNPKITVTKNKSFWNLDVNDFQITDLPKDIIKTQNPQLKFELGI